VTNEISNTALEWILPIKGQEGIRLVVWDLDETFWRGTLTEGGISAFVAEHEQIVIELANRGIMNSICSKNDFDAVKSILEERGIWQYFIFPSIDWSPKGTRVARLVETVGLRPPTVLFIDDNPGNRAEVASVADGVQVVDETVIGLLLRDARLLGKDDRSLSRLNQYKALERKKADEQVAGGDNLDFLRSSNIIVEIEHNVEAHLDRVVELINRTNQLNFTKRRLSEDASVARAQILEQMKSFQKQAGLVKVRDKYGDYGFVGFYLLRAYKTSLNLEHFCFSCRTLGMGVEAYVYQLIGRPPLKVAGDVLSDPIHAPQVNWINVQSDEDDAVKGGKKIPGFYLRGGCDLQAIGHYATIVAKDIAGEYNTQRGVMDVRLDHSLTSSLAVTGDYLRIMTDLEILGYRREDFESDVLNKKNPGAYLFSFGPDAWSGIYENIETGTLVPFHFGGVPGFSDPTRIPENERRNLIADPGMLAAVELLSQKYKHRGTTSEAVFKKNLSEILAHLPGGSPIFILTQFEEAIDGQKSPRTSALNGWVRDVAANFPNAHTLHIPDFVESADERLEQGHAVRSVYFRIFQKISDYLASSQGSESGALASMA
jgi:FkbH-like protein